MHPLFASSAYATPPWLPTKTRPPTTVGWDQAIAASGKPNAHFSVRLGTCDAVRPAAAEVWKCVLAALGLQPFHAAPERALVNGSRDVHRPIVAPTGSPDIVLPVRNSATARFSAPLSGRFLF